jgi:hypothetical protein
VSITTKVRVFLRSVCTTLQDISPQYTRWPEQELVSYANYGQLAMAKYLPQVGARLDAIKLQPGTRQDLALVLAANIIPGDGAAAADTAGIGLIAGPVRNMGANGLVPGRAARLIEASGCSCRGWPSPAAFPKAAKPAPRSTNSTAHQR